MKTSNQNQFPYTMKSRYTSLLIASALTSVVLIGCGEEDKATKLAGLKKQQSELTKQITELEKELAGTTKTEVKTKEVAALVVKTQPFDHYVKTQGLVEAEDNIMVSAKGMGVITQVFVKEGEAVTKGQTLAQIDNSLIARNVEGMKAQLELAVSVYERQKNLWDKKIGTEVQFLQAKTNKESLEKQLAAVQEQLDQTRIKSPINGVIDQVNVKVGENISPGMPAARVINNSNLKIVANVSEAYITQVKKGDKVKITIPDLKKEVQAKVSFAGRNIDPLSRTFVLEAELPSSAEFRPNMTALIKIVYASYPSVIAVPVNTVQNIKGEKVVFVAEASGDQTVARRKVVTVDGVFDGLAQVQGLAAGERVITAGFQGLTEGQYLKVQ
ncbi:MAG TPA: efflux RND transporter periplasmic adaptor subunit [Cytophagales bacterium]|jgi:membrane fusion protein (multidrug efflux system)|nr:efflux RND transporter periplasmic adaptor subunit [Cytophagales bacterium]